MSGGVSVEERNDPIDLRSSLLVVRFPRSHFFIILSDYVDSPLPRFFAFLSSRPRNYYPYSRLSSIFTPGSELALDEETVQGVLAACRQEIG